MPKEQNSEFESLAEAQGVKEVSENEYTARRFLAGVGEDPAELIAGKSIPLECNFEHLNGINFHKGQLVVGVASLCVCQSARHSRWPQNYSTAHPYTSTTNPPTSVQLRLRLHFSFPNVSYRLLLGSGIGSTNALPRLGAQAPHARRVDAAYEQCHHPFRCVLARARTLLKRI